MAPSSILPPASAREGRALRTRIGEIELARDAPLEQVEMSLEYDTRLDDMEIVDSGSVHAGQGLGKKVGLLLVVALEADPVPGPDDRLEKHLCALRRHHLATGVTGTRVQADVSLAALLLPVRHVVFPKSQQVPRPYRLDGVACACATRPSLEPFRNTAFVLLAACKKNEPASRLHASETVQILAKNRKPHGSDLPPGRSTCRASRELADRHILDHAPA